MPGDQGEPVPKPLDERCGYCGTAIPPLGTYCPACGAAKMSTRNATAPHPAPQWQAAWPPQTAGPVRRVPSWRLIIKTVLAFGMLSFVAQLFLSLAALIYGTTIVLPEIVHHTYVVYVVAPVLIAVGEISGDALGAYYLLLVLGIIASAAWLFLSSAGGFLKELRMKGEPRKHSALFDLCSLMFGVLFLNYLVVVVMSVFWEAPSVPTEGSELWELLFLLANASVWEELIVRVLLIGVPLFLIDLMRLSPKVKKYRYLLGGGFSLGTAEVVLILASSALFGFAHLEGWGAWKVFPSAVAGLAFGYMFLKHGLPSAIMLHFGFDYLSMPTDVFVQGEDLGALVLLGLAIIVWVAMGAVFFGYYLTRMVEFLTKEKYFEDRPLTLAVYPTYYAYRQAPPEPQPQPSYPQQGGPIVTAGPTVSQARPDPAGGFFVCPVCGYTGARWFDGKFQCLRCGAVM